MIKTKGLLTIFLLSISMSAWSGGSVLVNSLAGAAKVNGLCELSEAVEAIDKEWDIDGCLYQSNFALPRYIQFDTDLFAQGALPKSIVLSQPLTINLRGDYSIELMGPGVDKLTIRSSDDSEDPIIQVTRPGYTLASLRLSDFTLEGGFFHKPCIQGKALGRINNLIIKNMLLTGCTYSAIRDFSWVNILDSVLAHNRSPGAGGAISMGDSFGKLVIQGSILRNNQALLGGAVALNDMEIVAIRNSDFSNNRSWQGGSLYLDGDGKGNIFELQNTTFAHNAAALAGGAIYVKDQQSLSLSHVTVTQNLAGTEFTEGQGGGIFSAVTGISHSLKIINSVIVDNYHKGGPDDYIFDDLRIAKPIRLITENSAIRQDNGAIYAVDKASMRGIWINPQLSPYSLYSPGAKAFAKGYYMEAYPPKTTSPLVNSAQILGGVFNLDQLEESRSSIGNELPDIGAVEYQTGNGYVEFVGTPAIFAENEGTVGVPVARVGAFNGIVSVECTSAPIMASNAAVPNVDYIAPVIRLNWKDSESGVKYCPVILFHNPEKEMTKKFEMQLKNPMGGVRILGATFPVEIRDVD